MNEHGYGEKILTLAYLWQQLVETLARAKYQIAHKCETHKAEM